ncbi:nitrate reductase cytochrome c-type subunit [bacterium]|nr:nitrate reductase cytochrome c-type subunit [bacterium]MBU1994703.1 nitrate reductase cytochrome c-type subunit [bacterium]
MKTISKITIGLAAAAAAILFVGCSDSATPAKEVSKPAPTISEESLGLRKTNLYTEKGTTGDKTSYATSYAGSGNKIKRAFQDAPPMIPHDTQGMLPITINDNQCVGCHMPEVATGVGATAIPGSHFTDFRPAVAMNSKGNMTINGAVLENTSNETLKDISIKSTGDKLAGARFNCTQCHAPQSDSPAPKNTFEADYTSKDGANSSSWSGTKLMEGIDTVHGK